MSKGLVSVVDSLSLYGNRSTLSTSNDLLLNSVCISILSVRRRSLDRRKPVGDILFDVNYAACARVYRAHWPPYNFRSFARLVSGKLIRLRDIPSILGDPPL